MTRMPWRHLLDVATMWGIEWDLFWSLTPWTLSGIIDARRRAWIRDRTNDALFHSQTASAMTGGDLIDLTTGIFPLSKELLER